jgi:hypothetical protein
MDPKFNPLQDKVWVMKCRLKNYQTEGTKDMGYVSPKVRIKYNTDIPKIDFNFNFLIPWYDLKFEYVWYLDKQFNPTDEKIWAIKLKLLNGMPKQIKEMGYVSPKIIYNQHYTNYTVDDHIPYYELCYEQVWLNELGDNWVAKIVPHEPEGTKIVKNIKPKFN